LKRHSKQTRDIQTKSKALAGLRAEHGEYEKALDDVRAEQARACTADVQEEKKAKKAEKALEAKVH
jgi:structural maintenance of chromosome 1